MFTVCITVILGKSHYILYGLVAAMQPRMLVTFDEELRPLPVSVRVGQVKPKISTVTVTFVEILQLSRYCVWQGFSVWKTVYIIRVTALLKVKEYYVYLKLLYKPSMNCHTSNTM